MKVPRPSPAMVVALIALTVAVGGTAAALPGKFTVGRDDLKTSSVGARSLGKIMLGHVSVVRSNDPVANDGNFHEVRGSIECPSRAPLALDPVIGGLGPRAYEVKRLALPNKWNGPSGYEFTISSDQGPDVGYSLKVNCLFAR